MSNMIAGFPAYDFVRLQSGIKTHNHFRMYIQHLFNLDVSIARHGHLEQLMEFENDIDALGKLPEDQLVRILRTVPRSRAQNRQDVFALVQSDFKTGGYFVDFGATNGISLSNSDLLEKEFGWRGIVAEPGRCWHEQLRANRNCHIETACVWKASNKTLSFNEAASAELSTIATYSGSDSHKSARTKGTTYEVKTISLVDLLAKYDAPREIDFLSIDTEGSEFDILNAFDFSRYSFGAIVCEHNYTPMRTALYRLLTGNGYRRVYVGFSRWDDWYVRA